MSRPLVAISGGFDPVHEGHLELIDKAAELGSVVIIVNKDEFLVRKKGRPFYPSVKVRKFIMEHIKGVDEVVIAVDDDDTVCRTLELLKPDIFVNGGDRQSENDIPEAEVCHKIGCRLFFLDNKSKTHSRQLLEAWRER